jgi:hypothetical protein
MSSSDQPTDGIVVGSEAKAPAKKSVNKRRRLIIICVCAAAFLLVGGAFTYALVNANRADTLKEKVNADDLSDDYSRLTDDQVTRKFEAKTGLSIDVITKKPVSDKTLKSFRTAYQAAQALQALGNYGRAVTAYQIAEQKAGSGDANYVFYQRFSDAAGYDKQTDLSLQLLDKEATAIKNDAKLSADEKQTEIVKITQIKHLRKLGY